MLKRAACTIYFVQEGDTLGKDSELASTLAQGKPVIAFVPDVHTEHTAVVLEALQRANPETSRQELILEQLKLVDPRAAWSVGDLSNWIADPSSMDLRAGEAALQDKLAKCYEKRALTLRDTHPLGIQVNLATGVANGVLVVRTVEDCARLVRRILTRTLEFELEEREGLTLLIETISQCAYRVMTHDRMLTNSFWNFYFAPRE